MFSQKHSSRNWREKVQHTKIHHFYKPFISHKYINSIITLFTTVIIALLIPSVSCGALQLFDHNLKDILKNNDLVFVNFYADWCHFSQMLSPTYDALAEKMNNEIPDSGKLVIAKVDSEGSKDIAEKYHVSKYPTLKIFRHGEMTKKEYRGQRSVEAMAAFLREQMKDDVRLHSSLSDLDNALDEDNSKRHLVGHFDSSSSTGFTWFKRLASSLKDDCQFHAVLGEPSKEVRPHGDNIYFRPPDSSEKQPFDRQKLDEDFSILKDWASQKCIPFVREITFQNAEELTEEGLPFLILFYHPLRDIGLIKIFQEAVTKHLKHEKASINFLYADGIKFAHPLHHLGKSEGDLPVLAIDSFRHMYLFPHDVRTGVGNYKQLQEFIDDLHSGKLHREFHNGPDPTTTSKTTPIRPPDPDFEQVDVDTREASSEHVPKEPDTDDTISTDDQVARTKGIREKQIEDIPEDPPESVFVKLAPSKNRYTLIKDEL